MAPPAPATAAGGATEAVTVLTALHVRDLAVIEDTDLALAAGFTALTGETGAGKSLLIDALALATGERADARAVRSGAERLDVSATFRLDAEATPGLDWLRDNALDDGDECVLRRVVGSDGRSRAWINGRPVPVQGLRELGSRLIDICGQADYHSLRHPAVQRDALDSYADHAALREAVQAAHARHQAAAAALDRAEAAMTDRDARCALLRHQLDELAALNPQPGEATALADELRLLSHASRIAAGLDSALGHLDDDERGADAGVARALRVLSDLAAVDPQLTPPVELLNAAAIQIREAIDATRTRLDAVQQDPGRESEAADRLAALHDLARKHRVEADALPALRTALARELDDLENHERHGTTLRRERDALFEALTAQAAHLTASRLKAARRLEKAVTAQMTQLGMAGGRFVVEVTPRDVGADGADDVQYLVSTNPGQPPAAMARIASGGELSRIHLAIQVVAAGRKGVATLVFDEVDAGVGGAVAEIVGRQLRTLGTRHQVLCITHLPQVAAQAHQHAAVAKRAEGEVTRTTVRLLDARERLEETARMLGGTRITAKTRAHAREMIDAAGNEAPFAD